MNKKPGIVVITGPTAVGKTELSIKLAKAISGEIISADSIQVYKDMNIGSAKISEEEMEGVPHHLIDILNPCEQFDVATFKKLADTSIEKIYSNGHIPIIVGGTGFYIQAVLKGIDFEDNEDDGYRAYLTKLLDKKGVDYLYDMLVKEDPGSADAIHKNNTKRVIRALEYKHQTGRLISAHNEIEKQKSSQYNSAYFVLNCSRDILYKRINNRIDIMLQEGLVDEVKSLINKYTLTKEMTSMQGLGYKEIYDYLTGETSLDEAVEILKRDTRHFAKRQLTWFRREKDVIWVNKEDYESIDDQLAYIMKVLFEREIIK